MCDHVIYMQLLLKRIVATPSIKQNELHGLLLQILFMTKIAKICDNQTSLDSFIQIFMNHLQEIFMQCKVGLVRNTFFEVVLRMTLLMCRYSSRYSPVQFSTIQS